MSCSPSPLSPRPPARFWLAFKWDRVALFGCKTWHNTFIHVEPVIHFPCKEGETCIHCRDDPNSYTKLFQGHFLTLFINQTYNAKWIPNKHIEPPVSSTTSETEGLIVTSKWTYLRINDVDEVKAYNWMNAQIGKPFNWWGQHFNFLPCCCFCGITGCTAQEGEESTLETQKKWFCSELATALLIHLGYRAQLGGAECEPCKTTPMQLYKRVREIASVSESKQMLINEAPPVVIMVQSPQQQPGLKSSLRAGSSIGAPMMKR